MFEKIEVPNITKMMAQQDARMIFNNHTVSECLEKMHYIAYNINWSNPDQYDVEIYDYLGYLVSSAMGVQNAVC